jgi:hypothetical protein
MVRWRDPNRDAAGQGLNSYLARQLGIETAAQSRCRAIPATLRIFRIAFWDGLASHLEIPGTRCVNESAHKGRPEQKEILEGERIIHERNNHLQGLYGFPSIW